MNQYRNNIGYIDLFSIRAPRETDTKLSWPFFTAKHNKMPPCQMWRVCRVLFWCYIYVSKASCATAIRSYVHRFLDESILLALIYSLMACWKYGKAIVPFRQSHQKCVTYQVAHLWDSWTICAAYWCLYVWQSRPYGRHRAWLASVS